MAKIHDCIGKTEEKWITRKAFQIATDLKRSGSEAYIFEPYFGAKCHLKFAFCTHMESGNFCSPQFDKINAKYQAKSFPSFFYPDFSLHYWLCLGVKVKVGGKNSERFPRFISIWPRFHLLCEDHSSTCFYVQTAVADDLSRFKHHSKSCCHSCFWFLGLMHL